MWYLTCYACGHHAPMDDFEPSCADECTCPKCGVSFQVDLTESEDWDDGGDETDD